MSPTDVVAVKLSAEHQAYFQGELACHAEGGRLLGTMLGALDLDRGRMWGIVPAERAAMAVADLETDAIRTEAEREAVATAIVRRIKGLLHADPPRMLTVEYWTEVDCLNPGPHAFAVGDSQFDYVTAADPDELVADFLRWSLWYPTVGVISPIPPGVDLAQTRDLTVDQVEESVSRLDLVLVGAWTADGYVFWEPTGK